MESLFGGAGTIGERLAAEATLERVRARLADLGWRDPPIEMQCAMPTNGHAICFSPCAGATGCSPIVIVGSGTTP